jgi:hypothetical protein
LDKNKKNIEHRLEALIERSRQRLNQYRLGVLPARVAREWQPGTSRLAGLSFSADDECPACGATGTIEGEHVVETRVDYDRFSDYDVEPIVLHEVPSDYFSCSNCELVLDGYELIEKSTLSNSFEVEGEISDYFGEEYGND